MGYYFGNNGKKARSVSKETEEERNYRLVQERNKIFLAIDKVSDARGYMKLKNEINEFSKQFGVSDFTIAELLQKLRQRLSDLQEETKDNISKINSEIDAIKAKSYSEDPNDIEKLKVQSDQKLVEYVLQMNPNKDMVEYNKRKVGNWVANASRAEAIALARMSASDAYSHMFTAKQKDILLTKMKHPAEISLENSKQKQLEEKSSQLGKQTMKLFHLNNVQKQITNKDSAFWFKDSEVKQNG